MKNLILTITAAMTFAGPVLAQECATNKTQDVAERAILLAGGGDKGNGGFLFSRTSKKILDLSQEQLIADLRRWIETTTKADYKSESCDKVINLSALKTAVEEMTSSYFSISNGKNPRNETEPRFFHLNDESKVEATRIYFLSFVDTYFRYIEEKNRSKKLEILKPIKAGIVHESLHKQGYNEQEAQRCVPELLEKIKQNGCDPEARAKRMATYIINAHFKMTARGPGIQTNFTEEELFENKDFESLEELLENLYSGKSMKKSLKGLVGDNSIIFAIIRRDIMRNVLPINPANPNYTLTNDTKFSDYSCK